MYDLTPEGLRVLEDVARRHGVSLDAVVTMLRALADGHGSQAQFNHPEFGGMGQWSQGGMIMVGDMFNQGLKYRVDSLCNDLAPLARGRTPFTAPSGSFQSQSQGGSGYGGVSLFVPGSGSAPARWWPDDIGEPASVGAQNDLRYAYFPGSRRLAILHGGLCTVYDTGDHQIGGFSQQQGGDQSLTFTSQYGLVRVADLPRVHPTPPPASPAPPVSAPAPAPVQAAAPVQAQAQAHTWAVEPDPVSPPEPPAPVVPAPGPSLVAPPEPTPSVVPASVAAVEPPPSIDLILSTIERLAALRDKGILTDEEFSTKKTELLSRL